MSLEGQEVWSNWALRATGKDLPLLSVQQEDFGKF